MIFDLTKRKSGGGGDPYEVARLLAAGSNSLTEYVDDQLTYLRGYAFNGCTKLTKIICHNVTGGASAAFQGAGSSSAKLNIAFPQMTTMSAYAFTSSANIKTFDFEKLLSIGNVALSGSGNLDTLVLRKTSIVSLGSVACFGKTPFKDGGAGGTIYIPKSLYDHLGDGTANDYKAATNWATVDGYGTITWAKIEGSIYETQYADGTPIPTT